MKTFEQFKQLNEQIWEDKDTDNTKVWIIGIPSGEAVRVPYDAINALHKEKLIHYSCEFSETGFFIFEDDDLEFVRRYAIPSSNAPLPKIRTRDKEINILKNKFDKRLVGAVMGIINEYPTPIELFAQDDCMGITYGDYYLEIHINVDENSKYKMLKRHKSKVIDKYTIPTDKLLIDRIESELYL